MHRGFRIFVILQLITAGAMAFIGFIVSVRPYMLLDVVLSPEELQDQKIHDATLALMQRATSSDSILWFLFAGFVAALGLYGLRLGRHAA